MTSSNFPTVNFESVEVTNYGDNFNLNFVLSWQADTTDTWVNNADYIQFYRTIFYFLVSDEPQKHLELKQLASNPDTITIDAYNKLLELIDVSTLVTTTVSFSTFFEDFATNKQEYFNSGKVLERIVNGKKKYIFPFTIKNINIESLENVSVYAFGYLDILGYLADKGISESYADDAGRDYRRSLYDQKFSLGTSKFINLFLNGEVQQTEGYINNFSSVSNPYNNIESQLETFSSYEDKILNAKQSLLKNTLSDAPVLSNLYLSQNSNNDNFDVYFLLDKQKLYEVTSKLKSTSVEDDLEISSIDIYRKKVDVNDVVIDDQQQLVETTLTQLPIDLKDLIGYSFIDSYISSVPNQKFVYEIKLEAVDRKLKSIYNISDNTGLYFDVLNYITVLEEYLKIVISNFYNRNLNRIDESFEDTFYKVNNLAIIRYVDDYSLLIYKVYKVIISDTEKQTFRSFLNKQTASPVTIESVISLFKESLKNIEKIFKTLKTSNISYTKTYSNQIVQNNTLFNTYFSYGTKSLLSSEIKENYFNSSPVVNKQSFLPKDSKIFGLNYVENAYLLIGKSINTFVDNSLLNKLLNYYRLIDLQKNNISALEDYLDNFENENASINVAFSLNCVSDVNKYSVASSTDSNTQLSVRDEFKLNKYQLGTTSIPSDVVNRLPNKFNPKQNLNNLFGNQQSSITSTPIRFVENPDGIKSEAELLFYLFIYNTTDTVLEPLTFVPLVKIQYLNYENVRKTGVSNLVWKDLTPSNIDNIDKITLCKFEPNTSIQTNINQIKLLSDNIHDIIIKDKYFILTNNNMENLVFNPSSQQDTSSVNTNIVEQQANVSNIVDVVEQTNNQFNIFGAGGSSLTFEQRTNIQGSVRSSIASANLATRNFSRRGGR